MKKLLQFFDNYLLKIGVSLIIAFIPLYPKLPSIAITNTWVYIRLEDFLITAVVIIWFIQLLRKKVFIPVSLSIPFGIYWLIGLCSLIFSIIFIGPHLANFFPKIAALQYARRIEYMILFFVGFSSVKTKKDIRDYLIVLSLTILGVLLYGLGQRFYLQFWAAFPDFARKFPFCFPSFQTGNEEFAKGIPLCLPQDARITSTFGGHYDLAAYLVVIIPVIVSIFAMVKKTWIRILTGLLSVGSIMLLIFTASRISFAAYLIGTTFSLILLKRKKYILPIFLISFIILVAFSGSLAKRFLETIRFTSIVTNNQGQVVGVAQSSLPADLQNKIAKNSAIEENIPTQNLPTGSSFLTLPGSHSPIATNVAVVKTSLTAEQIKQLKLKNGGVELSTVSGNFLVQKALVYDISFTTRFQGEWPHAWAAFMQNPLLGTGFSSITLAADNDYLRNLGESGFLGLCSFLLIFIFFGILIKKTISGIKGENEQALILGLTGGVIGLFINASLIDVFEASKVAEPLWTLLGIGAGAIFLYKHKSIAYWKVVKNIFLSPFFICFYLLILTLIIYLPSLNNFFVGDDFTWLHWAAVSTGSSFKDYFLHSTGFFYRPLAKSIIFVLYTFFSFYPQGYHFFIILLHFLMAYGIYLLANLLIKRRYLAFISGALFLILPGRAENFFWISTFSIELSAVFLIYSCILFIKFRNTSSLISYIFSIIFAVLGFFSYEGAAILPLILIVYDLLISKQTLLKKVLLSYIPYGAGILFYLVMRYLSNALGPNGDYSYNIVHLVPNFLGNLLGYCLLFIFGQSALPLYASLRENVKSLPIILVIFVIACAFLLFISRKLIGKVFKNKQFTLLFFLLSFIFIALLPFLGLGNINQRYGYFASAGFTIFIVYLLSLLTQRTFLRIQYLCISVVIFLFGIFAYSQIVSTNNDWNKAGQITNNALTYIKIYADDVTPGSKASFYFVNIPIKYKDAWVFPVGLEDGLWFIYRDPSIQVIKASSAETVLSETNSHKKNSYIFTFDSKGNLKEIDHHAL